MAETFEELSTRLQQTQAEYLQTLQQLWDVWLKQYAERNEQLLKAQQDALAQLAAGCAAVPPKR